jgi:hypothetical protein
MAGKDVNTDQEGVSYYNPGLDYYSWKRKPNIPEGIEKAPQDTSK